MSTPIKIQVRGEKRKDVSSPATVKETVLKEGFKFLRIQNTPEKTKSAGNSRKCWVALSDKKEIDLKIGHALRDTPLEIPTPTRSLKTLEYIVAIENYALEAKRIIADSPTLLLLDDIDDQDQEGEARTRGGFSQDFSTISSTVRDESASGIVKKSKSDSSSMMEDIEGANYKAGDKVMLFPSLPESGDLIDNLMKVTTKGVLCYDSDTSSNKTPRPEITRSQQSLPFLVFDEVPNALDQFFFEDVQDEDDFDPNLITEMLNDDFTPRYFLLPSDNLILQAQQLYMYVASAGAGQKRGALDHSARTPNTNHSTLVSALSVHLV